MRRGHSPHSAEKNASSETEEERLDRATDRPDPGAGCAGDPGALSQPFKARAASGAQNVLPRAVVSAKRPRLQGNAVSRVFPPACPRLSSLAPPPVGGRCPLCSLRLFDFRGPLAGSRPRMRHKTLTVPRVQWSPTPLQVNAHLAQPRCGPRRHALVRCLGLSRARAELGLPSTWLQVAESRLRVYAAGRPSCPPATPSPPVSPALAAVCPGGQSGSERERLRVPRYHLQPRSKHPPPPEQRPALVPPGG